MKSLMLVRGNDAGGENQDLFVVANGKDDASRAKAAIDIWNTWCVNNEWSRDEGDHCDPSERYEPEGVRIILEDVTGTEHDVPAQGLEWGGRTLREIA